MHEKGRLLRVLLKRAPKICSYLLWAIVLYRLLCPFTFVSPLSFLGIFGETDGAQVQIAEVQSAVQGVTLAEERQDGKPDETAVHTERREREVRLSRRTVLRIASYVWAAGAAAMFLYGGKPVSLIPQA